MLAQTNKIDSDSVCLYFLKTKNVQKEKRKFWWKLHALFLVSRLYGRGGQLFHTKGQISKNC